MKKENKTQNKILKENLAHLDFLLKAKASDTVT